jgi:signal transduction histidine kinase
LNDSVLIADAYNFMGLFLMNTGTNDLAIQNYKKGITYVRQPPNPSQYISLTKPHHLYGNLSECYLKINVLDSALYYGEISLKKALEINSTRGISIAYKNLGDIYSKYKLNEKSESCYLKGYEIALKESEFDAALACLGGAATCVNKNDIKSIRSLLNEGFGLMNKNTSINQYYKLEFLKYAIKAYENANLKGELINALNLNLKTSQTNIDETNKQIQNILNLNFENEKINFAIQLEARRKNNIQSNIIFTCILFALLSIVAAGVYYIKLTKEKLLTANLINESNKTVEAERNRIASEMHDELGSSLTVIKYLSERTAANSKEEAVRIEINKIAKYSSEVIHNLSEIIWAMNSRYDYVDDLVAHLRAFSSKHLEDQKLTNSFNYNSVKSVKHISSEKRRNIQLAYKEIIHNSSKHSNAESININIEVDENLSISILEKDGKKYNLEESSVNGNGLYNIQKRITDIGGKVSFTSNTDGNLVTLSIPLNT